MRAPKHQQLLVLQREFDTATENIGLRAPTIATTSLLKLVLTLGFRMESQNELTTGQEVPARRGESVRHGGLRRGRPFHGRR